MFRYQHGFKRVYDIQDPCYDSCNTLGGLELAPAARWSRGVAEFSAMVRKNQWIWLGGNVSELGWIRMKQVSFSPVFLQRKSWSWNWWLSRTWNQGTEAESCFSYNSWWIEFPGFWDERGQSSWTRFTMVGQVDSEDAVFDILLELSLSLEKACVCALGHRCDTGSWHQVILANRCTDFSKGNKGIKGFEKENPRQWL